MVENSPIYNHSIRDISSHVNKQDFQDALYWSTETKDVLMYTPEILTSDKEPAQVQMFIPSKYNSDGKTRGGIGLPENIERGYIYESMGVKWLAISAVSDFEAYKKIDLKQCNRTIELKTEMEHIQIGVDSFGRPIYREIAGKSYDIPCIVDASYYSINSNRELVIPDGQITITLPYFKNIPNFEVNDDVTIDKRNYKVLDHILTESIDEVGLLIIKLQRRNDDE